MPPPTTNTTINTSHNSRFELTFVCQEMILATSMRPSPDDIFTFRLLKSLTPNILAGHHSPGTVHSTAGLSTKHLHAYIPFLDGALKKLSLVPPCC